MRGRRALVGGRRLNGWFGFRNKNVAEGMSTSVRRLQRAASAAEVGWNLLGLQGQGFANVELAPSRGLDFTDVLRHKSKDSISSMDGLKWPLLWSSRT
jgi:hypothetical protein